MVNFGFLLEKLYFEVLLVKKLKTSQGTYNVEILLHRARRGSSECQPRRRPEEVVAEAAMEAARQATTSNGIKELISF